MSFVDDHKSACRSDDTTHGVGRRGEACLARSARDRRIVCMCRSGNRSGRVVAYLLEHGFDAVNLAGGAQQWASFGHPLVNHVGNAGVVA